MKSVWFFNQIFPTKDMFFIKYFTIVSKIIVLDA